MIYTNVPWFFGLGGAPITSTEHIKDAVFIYVQSLEMIGMCQDLMNDVGASCGEIVEVGWYMWNAQINRYIHIPDGLVAAMIYLD